MRRRPGGREEDKVCKRALATAFGLLALILPAGCGPSGRGANESEVRISLPGLLAPDWEVVANAMSYDVDGALFRFRDPSAQRSEQSEDALISRALGDGWERVADAGKVTVLKKVFNYDPYFSLQVLKLHASTDGWVYVCYIQFDLADDPPADLAQLKDGPHDSQVAHARGDWWPRFEEYAGLEQ